jgi:hypothetical protein
MFIINCELIIRLRRNVFDRMFLFSVDRPIDCLQISQERKSVNSAKETELRQCSAKIGNTKYRSCCNWRVNLSEAIGRFPSRSSSTVKSGESSVIVQIVAFMRNKVLLTLHLTMFEACSLIAVIPFILFRVREEVQSVIDNYRCSPSTERKKRLTGKVLSRYFELLGRLAF